jgi:hypothetical protein
LAVVTVDSDIIEVLRKMPHIYTNAEYADMLYVYGFCDGSATAAVEECRRRFPLCRIPDRRKFSKVCNTLHERGALPSTQVSSERARQQPVVEEENILEMVQRIHTARTQTLCTRLGVSQTHVWRTLHHDGLYPFHPQRVQNLHPGDSDMFLEFCHWLHTNRQLLPLILFTDEANFTRNGIYNTRNSHRRSHDNPHGTVETNFRRRFSVCVVRCDR